MIIEYKGQTLDTIHYADLTDEECEDIRRDLQRKPSKEDVRKNLKRMANGGGCFTII